MGCFSWDCACCHHSIRAAHATITDSSWLAEAVLVEADGSTIRGEYDGYGRLTTRSGREIEGLADGREEPCLFHQACFDILKPVYRPSRSAHDQGHFVGDYDPRKPRSVEDVQALKKAADEKLAKDREEARVAREQMRAEYVAKGEPVPAWL